MIRGYLDTVCIGRPKDGQLAQIRLGPWDE
jgi:hypothetical protein